MKRQIFYCDWRLVSLFKPLVQATLASMLCLNWVAALASPTRIVYPLPESSSDSRYQYDWEVLRLALEKTLPKFGPFELRASDERMSPARVTQEMLTTSPRLNLFVRATSQELEQKLLPIRIPIDRGLLGYRIFLVRKNDLSRFANISDLSQLRQLRAGQGRAWADIAILQAAGLPVVEGSNYEGLFGMLEAGRFDYFSRAVDEALREIQERQAAHPELAVEPNLLLYYPLPRYFFVRQDADGRKLAHRISTGLEIMLRDGSLEALFNKYKEELILRAGLNKRRLIRIPNPNLSPLTPLERKELWYTPTE